MKRGVILCLLLVVGPSLADEIPSPIAVSEVDHLTWLNLVLDADARQARGEKLLAEAASMREKATAKIAEIKKRLNCEECEAQLSKEGKLQLTRPEKKK